MCYMVVILGRALHSYAELFWVGENAGELIQLLWREIEFLDSSSGGQLFFCFYWWPGLLAATNICPEDP